MSTTVGSQQSADGTLTRETNKKRKLVTKHANPRKKAKRGTVCSESRRMSSLPVDILSCIFQFTDPKTLGRLMRVCKSFNAVLTEHSMV